MNKKLLGIGIPVACIVILLIWGFSSYNGLVTKQEEVNGKWSQVENTYQRRADLVPNLVNTVKGYAAHEQQTLTDVVEARAGATSVKLDPDKLTEENLARFQQAQDHLSQALGRLLMIREQYPNLKADQNFLQLQSQLEGTENRIAVARRDFIESAKAYNTSLRMFPRNIVARLAGIEKRPYFESAPGAEKAPVVQF